MSATSTNNLVEELAELANAGNRPLAEHKIRQILKTSEAIQNPQLWLWMAWLAPSPAAMVQVLKHISVQSPGYGLAKAGIEWSEGLAKFVPERIHPFGNSGGALDADNSCTSEVNNYAAESVLQLIQSDYGSPVEGDLADQFKQVTDSNQESVTSALGHFELCGPSSGGLFSSKRDASKEQILAPDVLNFSETAIEASQDNVIFAGSADYSLAVSEIQNPQQAIDDVTELQSSSEDSTAVVVQAQPVESHFKPEGLKRAVDGVEIATRSPKQAIVPPSPGVSGRSTESRKSPTLRDKANSIAGKTVTAPNVASDGKSDGQIGGQPLRAIHNILVVDDSPTVRKLLTMMLTQGGYNVTAAVDGVDAAKHIASDPPHLIITDINMPRLDGYKLCKLVTRNERTKHIPVVMISAGMIDSLRGKLVGCKTFLTKPITPEALMAVVASQLPAVANN